MLGRHLCFAPSTSSVIVDGAAIVQMLKPAAATNFAEYASEIFIPYIILQLHSASLVWDRYIEDSPNARQEQSVKKECAGV